ncbi:MAG: type II 3-dehydroquinate dehydratase [Arsenophonus sp.]|nr:MAG: type II 3-dehydroquinate dehydratase [Arsenophonus sp.]
MVHNFHILILNGPNLNMIGKREILLYGNITLQDIIKQTFKKAKKLGIKLTHFQSNAEHKLIDTIHHAKKTVDFIIINPAGFTHTSIALRDALLSIAIPFYEIHITNIYSREKFRHHSYFSDIAKGLICGFHADGYIFALESAVKFLLKTHNIKDD